MNPNLNGDTRHTPPHGDDRLACARCLALYEKGEPTCDCRPTWRGRAVSLLLFVFVCAATVFVAAAVASMRAR